MGVQSDVVQEDVMKTNSIQGFSVKGILTKVVVAGALAGAVLIAAPQKAEAQGFRIGVQIGHPGYYAPVAPVVYGPAYGYREDFHARQRREEFLRHEAWERHERFEHRDFDRDRHFYRR
jgi:hypothetical protein